MCAAFCARFQILLLVDVTHRDHCVTAVHHLSQFIACDHVIHFEWSASGDPRETSTSAIRLSARFNIGQILDVSLHLCGHHKRGMAMLLCLQLAPADYAIQFSERNPQLASGFFASEKRQSGRWHGR
ncbi:hypothetical protein I6F30_00960 [Bradyrhizobium sp. NBAIM20]|uniref:hypothetical protein n=1 Tax=unclassified Bradyrhizobium TaxID=2631580 RepID=UPI001CD709F4|nr:MULTISPECIES: hypothetical protein [unclassified Bradyrhizobium]MCA1409735.1 hypothetical protein [Bradyrhizobium sp. NBAIM20]MCA1459366.1 hypothetical protein [Bradyrhizobium sp. NBAIM18]